MVAIARYDISCNRPSVLTEGGGAAYSAPMALRKVNSGNWTAYNIGRDYLGRIPHIATSNGTLVAEYSYDPWGRQREPGLSYRSLLVKNHGYEKAFIPSRNNSNVDIL